MGKNSLLQSTEDLQVNRIRKSRSMRSFFLVVLVVASVSVSEQRKCTGTYFETGDKAGNGRDRPPAGTPCKGGCIEEGGRWGNNYCDTEDGNWGSECVDCPEPMCTGGFFETSAGNGAARPPPGTPCAKPCAPLSGRWGENFCYTQDKAGKYGSDGEWDGSGII